jgi:16S rRNA (cytidine1402-2'-O)-methyltransferase
VSGTLYLVGVPIGNPEDLGRRAVRILESVAVIAAEDPLVTRSLLDRYGIPTPLTSYQDRNKEEKAPILIARLLEGRDVALVCDGGTPSINDPGAFLVDRALTEGIRVSPIPGPSALTASLSASGFGFDSFVHAGVVPRSPKARRRFLGAVVREPRTVVLFDSVDRIRATLLALSREIGPRRIALATDLTLASEACFRGTVQDVLAQLPRGAVGEAVTVVIEARAPEAGRRGEGGQNQVAPHFRIMTR